MIDVEFQKEIICPTCEGKGKIPLHPMDTVRELLGIIRDQQSILVKNKLDVGAFYERAKKVVGF